jgi:hypothetical protein
MSTLPEAPSKDPVDLRRARHLAIAATALGVLLIGLGAVGHNVVGLPKVMAAAADDRLGLPSNLEVGLGVTRETLVTSWFLMGMCMAAVGGVLMLLAPSLRRGDPVARKITLVLAVFFVTVFTVPWIAFEHMVPRPLPVPLAGLILLFLLIRSREVR